MRCPSCGNDVPDAAAFCPECGSRIEPAGIVSAPAAGAVAATAAERAPMFARLVAWLADVIVASGIQLAAEIWFIDDVVNNREPMASGVITALLSLWALGYFLFKDGLPGGSLGKRLLGLSVAENSTGAPAGFGRSAARNAVVLLLAMPAGLGLVVELIAAAVNGSGRRLGDLLASTRVVRSGEAASARGRTFATAAVGLSVAVLLLALVFGGASILVGTQEMLSKPHSGAASLPAEPSETPEAVVERFYQAADNGDLEGVRAALSADIADEFPPDALEGWDRSSTRDVGEASVIDSDAVVPVTEDGNGILGGPDGDVLFELVLSDDGWRITGWE